MLDHDEEQTLAQIEANLRLEAPELQRILEAEIADMDELMAFHEALEAADEQPSAARRWAKAGLAFTLAVVAIALTTFTLGPDLGGLVGAIGLTVALAYAYQTVRGCPGQRRLRR